MVILNLPITKVELDYLPAVLISATTAFVVLMAAFTDCKCFLPTKIPPTNEPTATTTIIINVIILFVIFLYGLDYPSY